MMSVRYKSVNFGAEKGPGSQIFPCSRLTSATRGENSAYFKCGVVRFVLVTGGVCHDPPMYWVLVIKMPERERSRVTFMDEQVSKIGIFVASRDSSIRLTKYYQVDMMGVRYESVNFGAMKVPGSQNRSAEMDWDRARTGTSYAGGLDAFSGQSRAYLAVGRLIEVNYLWTFSVTFAVFMGK